MACSKYASTKQTTNAARVSRLLLDPCTDLLRDVLRHYIPETSFPGTLQSQTLTIKPLLNATQRAILYPQQGTFAGNYQDFDISLLYLLLRNIAGIAQHGKGWGKIPNLNDRSVSANIERIRNLRNVYIGHINQSSMSDSQFNSVWQQVRNIASQLVQDVRLTTDYFGLIDRLEHETMDPELEKAYLKKLDDTEQTLSDLRDRQEEQRQIMKDHQADVQSKHRKILDNLADIRGQILITHEKRGAAQAKPGGDLQLLKEVQDQEAEKTLDTTKEILLNHKSSSTYIRTGQIDTVKQRLLDQRIVIMTGRPGDGKSTAAKQVMCELSENEEYVPAIITEPREWKKVVNSKQKMIVHVDDMFGSTNLDVGAIDKWKKLFDLMKSSASEGKILILITSRTSIIAEVRTLCQECFLINPKCELNLASNVITSKEKEKMLLQYEKVKTYKVSELIGDNFREYEKLHGNNAVYNLNRWERYRIMNSDPYYGFPQTCFLFFARNDFFQLGVDFFFRPNRTLFENIDNMRKSTDERIKIRYCTLAYVFLEGKIHMFDVKTDIFQEICGKSRLTKSTDVDVEDAVQHLEGMYLSPSNQMHVFTFCHVTIREAVAASFGKLAPDIVIQKCSVKTIRELIRTEGYKARAGEVILTIRKKYYSLLANRLMAEDTNHGVDHPASDDPEFTPVLFDVINKSPHNSGEIIKKIWDYEDKPVLYKEILTRYGPHHIKLKDQSVDDCDSDTSVERPYLITCVEVKERLDRHLFWGNKHRAIIIIRYVISNCDVNYFLDSCDPEFCDIRGMSVLHYCVARGWTDVVNEILDAVTPNKTENNWSCLHFAAFFGRFEIFKKIEKLSYNVLETTREGYKLLQVVLLGLRHAMRKSFNSLPLYYLSVSETSENNVYLWDISEEPDFINIVQHVMTGYPSLITSTDMPLDNFNNNIIHYLVIHDREEIYDMLVEKKNDLIFHRNDTELPTTIHVAAYLGRVKFVEKLWKAGVRAEVTDLSIGKSIESGKVCSNKTLTCNDSHVWRDQKYNDVENIKIICFKNQSIRFGSSEDYIAIAAICLPAI